ncbi:MAG: HAD hydrolase-like protein [Balneolaceae bacterium]
MKPILLYDIDGTLLQVHSSFLRPLISQHLTEMGLSKPESINRSFAGRTDRGIFMELIEGHPSPDELYTVLKGKYVKAMIEQLSPKKVERFDEAIESVHIAKEAGFHVGLCTGNFREVAFAKVNTVGLNDAFSFGGFGCNHSNRNFLPQSAHHNFQSIHRHSPKAEQYVIIGDTPKDILCAKYFGARVIAVTTGGFTKEELEKYNPDYVLNDLSNPKEWLTELEEITRVSRK